MTLLLVIIKMVLESGKKFTTYNIWLKVKSDHESNFKIKVAFILVLNDFDGKMFLDVNIFQGIDNNFPFLIRQKSN